jgi:hypothetical protein
MPTEPPLEIHPRRIIDDRRDSRIIVIPSMPQPRNADCPGF